MTEKDLSQLTFKKRYTIIRWIEKQPNKGKLMTLLKEIHESGAKGLTFTKVVYEGGMALAQLRWLQENGLVVWKTAISSTKNRDPNRAPKSFVKLSNGGTSFMTFYRRAKRIP
jgi:hypothetical protein